MSKAGGRVLIVSGGTGGHIFPAIVFGRWLEERLGLSVSWLCGSRPLEAEIYASAGIAPYRLPLEGSPLGVRSPRVILRRSLALFSAFAETSRCLRGVRQVFLFGGYISFAPLFLCRLRGLPVTAHEQNAVAGRVTRLASRLGATVASGWRECRGIIGPFTPVGIPTREPERLPPAEALKRLGLPEGFVKAGRKIVGVAGGSLGSRSLVKRLLEVAEALPGRAFLFLGDPGEGGEDAPPNVHFVGRQWDMNPFYSLCGALVCRAGGSTLAEALRWRIPAVAIPWKGAAEGHQEQNARCFAEMGGGLVWQEEDSGHALAQALERLAAGRPEAQAVSPDACEALAKVAGMH